MNFLFPPANGQAEEEAGVKSRRVYPDSFFPLSKSHVVLHVDYYIPVSVSLPPVSSRYVLLRLNRLIRIHMLKGAVRRALLVSALNRASRLHRLAGDTGGGSTGSKQAVRVR